LWLLVVVGVVSCGVHVNDAFVVAVVAAAAVVVVAVVLLLQFFLVSPIPQTVNKIKIYLN